MKRDKVSAFLKSKGFYVSLFAGIFAVFVLTMVYANVNSIKRQSEEDLSEYMENPDNVAEVNPVGESAIDAKPDTGASDKSDTAGQDGPDSSQTADGRGTGEGSQAGTDKEDGSMAAGTPGQDETADKAVGEADGQDTDASLASGAELESEYGDMLGSLPSGNGTGTDVASGNTADAEPASAVNEAQNALQNLHFNEETGLLWPAAGNIIKNYSMEKLVYFETLNQYKVNPAILIGLEAGSDVICAAKGVVTAVAESEELGNTLLIDIGDGYQLKYAQLDEVAVKVGDLVEEGQALAKVAEPTIYYSLEGSNLYFQVLQDGETVNPLLLLR